MSNQGFLLPTISLVSCILLAATANTVQISDAVADTLAHREIRKNAIEYIPIIGQKVEEAVRRKRAVQIGDAVADTLAHKDNRKNAIEYIPIIGQKVEEAKRRKRAALVVAQDASERMDAMADSLSRAVNGSDPLVGLETPELQVERRKRSGAAAKLHKHLCQVVPEECDS